MSQILVIKPSSFGDIVHGLQVAESIRSQVPRTHFSWIAASGFAPLVKACDTVETVYEFPRHAGLGSFLSLMREVRKIRFDYVLDMQGLARSGLMTFMANGRMKIGRRDAREGAKIFCPRVVAAPDSGFPAHAIDVLLPFISALGLEPQLAGSLSFKKAPQTNLARMIPPGDGPVVAVFPESRQAAKNWPGFTSFMQQLVRARPDVRLVWSARGADSPKITPPTERFVDITTRCRIEQLPAVLSCVDWVVCNDSGPLHLAAALGTRTLGIFGPTDPRICGAYPVDGAQHRSMRAPEGDLRRLGPEEVLDTLLDAGLGDGQRAAGVATGS